MSTHDRGHCILIDGLRMYFSERTVSLGTVSRGRKSWRQKPLTVLTVAAGRYRWDYRGAAI